MVMRNGMWMGVLFGLLTVCGAVAQQGETYRVVSPDSQVTVQVTVGDGLSWSLSRKGTLLVLPSRLGLAFKDQQPFGRMRVADRQERTIDTVWENRLYRQRRIRDYARELTLHLEETDAPKRKLDLVFRAYDTGIAFRYGIPAQPGLDTFTLTADETACRFAGDPEGWITTYGGYKTSQECPFNHVRLSSIKPDVLIGSPMIIEVGNQLAAFAEADLTDWSGMFFAVSPEKAAGTEVVTRLSPRLDGQGLVVSRAPRLAPWRVVILGDKPVDLVNHSALILTLNPPPEGGDAAFAWVKPGATGWDWWVGSKLTQSGIREQIDFAAEMGWPYHTIDAGWYGRPNHGPGVKLAPRADLDFPALFAYAKEKGVGLWLWVYWSALEDNGIDTTFDAFEQWGVKGVKIDFMDRQDQEMVQWYEKVVRSAAKHHILVNFHGAFKPTGMNRTWPNQITREGILGNEYNKFSDRVTPAHTATLPFTRYLLGPGDFTPGSFDNVFRRDFVQQNKRKSENGPVLAQEIGTRAHALALCVAYDSPLMTLCDWPERYRGQPGVELLRNLPTVWDQTIALAGEIARYYSVARQSADGAWYWAAMTVEPRRLEQPLTFLGEGTYTATLYTDASDSARDARALAIRTQTVTARDTLTLDLAAEGGSVVVFRKTAK